MAADYASGVSSSPQNLLQTLVGFLVTQGWTSDRSASEGSGWWATLHKNGLYVNLRAAMDEKIWWRPGPEYHDYGDGGYGIGLYLGDGYSAVDEWYEQSGGPVRPGDGSTIGCGANLPAGAVAGYHIFDDGADNIIVVVERQPGIFCHFGFGPAMAAAGQPEDFPYFFGSSSALMNTHDGVPPGPRYGINVTALAPMSPGDKDYDSISGYSPYYMHSNGLVRVDAATFSGRWVGNGDGAGDGYAYTGRFMRAALNDNPAAQTGYDKREFISYLALRGRSHQVAYAGAILLPLHCFVLTDPGARWAPVGYPPSIFWCEAVGNGYSGGDVYQVGGQNYIVFPGFAVWKGA